MANKIIFNPLSGKFDYVTVIPPSSGNTTIINKELPIGVIDGINNHFELSLIPVLGSEHIYVNGSLQSEGDDYTIIDNLITFLVNSIPQTGWKLKVTYSISNPNSNNIYKEAPTGNINGVNNTFVLNYTPVLGSEHIFINGTLQSEGDDYNILGNIITFLPDSIPQLNWKLKVSYTK